MTVARMKMFQIIGHRNELDPISYQVIKSHAIHLINYKDFMLNDLPEEELRPIKRDNPYTKLLNKIERLLDDLDIQGNSLSVPIINNFEDIDVDLIEEELEPIVIDIRRLLNFRERLKREEERLKNLKRHLYFIRNMDVNLDELKKLNYISLIFGRINRSNFERLIKNISDLPILILDVYREEDNIWFFSFTKKEHEEKALNFLNSVYFERLELPSRVKGQPREILNRAEHRLERIKIAYQEIELEMEKYRSYYQEKLIKFQNRLRLLSKIREINNEFYGEINQLFVLNGWIPAYLEEDFVQKLEYQFPDIVYSSEEADLNSEGPPTMLKNSRWVKPFEGLVKLYGIPRYGEIDPSFFVAVTYLLMFGLMFGDVGQGLIFMLAGYYIFQGKVSFVSRESGLLLLYLGGSSTLFGLLYGSIFGIEDVLPALWLRPMENIMLLLGVTVGLGIILMVVSMIINLVNSIRLKELKEGIFSRNGISGLFFYIFVLLSGYYLFVKGESLLDIRLTVLLLALPLVLILLKEPLGNLLAGKKMWPERPGEYFLEAGFELLDTLIAFLSNTVSFVRLGAFALNHIGLFMAVFILAEMVRDAAGGTFWSILVLIGGNILIMVLEGLVVGIQVLRLEYFELFGKFYKGDGKQFSPVEMN